MKPNLPHEYFDEFLKTNTGLTNPYHDLHHALRVSWCVAQGAHFQNLDTNTVGTLYLAGLFHDWGHPGVMGNDRLNVLRAADKVRSLSKSNSDVDFDLELAANAIIGTEFPLPPNLDLTFDQKILRDADYWHCAYLNEEDWLSLQVGLAKEAGKTPQEWLTGNTEFVRTVPALSPWGQLMSDKYRGMLIARVDYWAKRMRGEQV